MLDIQEMPVFTITFDMLVAFHKLRVKMPKTDRYSLGARIEDELVGLLTDIMETGRVPKPLKGPFLERALRKNDTLKILIRLGDALGLFPDRRGLPLQATLQRIGSMLGGWRRSST